MSFPDLDGPIRKPSALWSKTNLQSSPLLQYKIKFLILFPIKKNLENEVILF